MNRNILKYEEGEELYRKKEEQGESYDRRKDL
jgi:hypothetical protein